MEMTVFLMEKCQLQTFYLLNYVIASDKNQLVVTPLMTYIKQPLGLRNL